MSILDSPLGIVHKMRYKHHTALWIRWPWYADKPNTLHYGACDRYENRICENPRDDASIGEFLDETQEGYIPAAYEEKIAQTLGKLERAVDGEWVQQAMAALIKEGVMWKQDKLGFRERWETERWLENTRKKEIEAAKEKELLKAKH
jgi:hypothetical protein